MLKRLLCILLVTMLTVSAVSCRRGTSPTDHGEATDAATLPTTTTAEDDTASDEPFPTDPNVRSHFSDLSLNDVPCFDGDPLAGLSAADYTLPVQDGTILTSISLSGWVGFSMAIDAFGYSIDGGEAVYGLFSTYTDKSVKAEGGDYALCFSITAPLFALKAGSHTVTFVARLADGSVVGILPTISLSREGLTVDASRPYHSSLTHVNGQGPNGTAAYEGRGGSSDRGVDILDATLNGHTVDPDRRIRISGWLAVDGGVERYVWSADGIVWYPAVTNGQTGEPSTGYFAELGHENATENATFGDLILDLTPYQERNVAITVGGIPKDAPHTVVPFVTVTGLNVPYLPHDIDYSYSSKIEGNTVGCDLQESDLSPVFQFVYGAGDIHHVNERDGKLVYAYEGLHSFQASMEGLFAMTARVREMRGCSFFFIRGTRAVRSVVDVPLRLDNFYETDGAGLCGGAGIYAKLHDGTLTVVIKGLDPTADYRVKNHIYTFPAEGDTLTLVDDGSSVHILVNGRKITSILLRGETEYPEHFASIIPLIRFAKTAEILLADGNTATVQNTLVASTCQAQCGAAIRGGALYFDEISLIPYSEHSDRE